MKVWAADHFLTQELNSAPLRVMVSASVSSIMKVRKSAWLLFFQSLLTSFMNN